MYSSYSHDSLHCGITPQTAGIPVASNRTRVLDMQPETTSPKVEDSHRSAPSLVTRRFTALQSALSVVATLVFLWTVGLLATVSTFGASPAGPTPPSAQIPAGFDSRSALVNGTRIHYVMGGHGDPVLLIHGWPETWFEWRKVMPLLARDHIVVAADMRGFGDSGLEVAGYDKKTLAEDLHQLMLKLGFPHAALVGHDWGGPVAYAYAAQHRDAVSKLVMIEGAPFGPWSQTTEPLWFFHLLRLPDRYAEKLITGHEAEFLSYFFFNRDFHVVPVFEANVVQVYNEAYSRPGRMGPTYALYQTIDTDVADNAIFARQALDIPVLAIGARRGGGDFAAQGARAVADHVSTVIFEKTGHFIPEERPEPLVAVIEAFLQGRSISKEWNPESATSP